MSTVAQSAFVVLRTQGGTVIVPFRQPVGAAQEDWEALAAWVLESDEIVIQPCANGIIMAIGEEERLVPHTLEHSFRLALDLGWGCA